MANIRSNAEVPSVDRMRVASHEQLDVAISVVARHLEEYPEDGIFLLLDPARAMSDLGIDLSAEIAQHVRHAASAYRLTAQDTGDLSGVYTQIKSGKCCPVDIRVKLRRDGASLTSEWSSISEVELENHPLSRIAALDGLKTRESSIDTQETQNRATFVPIPVDEAHGYDVVIQISQDAVNNVIAEAFNHGGVKSSWSGVERLSWNEFGVDLAATYAVELSPPSIVLGQPTQDAVSLSIAATAKLKLEIDVRDLPELNRPLYEFDDSVEIGFEITLQAGIKVGPGSRAGLAAVMVDLLGIRDLRLSLNTHELPPSIVGAVEQVLLAVTRSELMKQGGISLTMDIEEAARAGVPIKLPDVKILPASGASPAALTVLIDLDSTGTTPGSKDQIQYFIPAGQDFAFIITAKIINTGWNIAKASRFPVRDGDMRIDGPEFRLLDDRMFAKVSAHYKLVDGCLGSWTIDADARIWVSLRAFEKDGIWHVAPNTVRTDIDMDSWDRFVFETILGALLYLLGIGGPIARSVISTIIFEVILGLAEKYAAGAIGGYSVGIYGKVPGTDRIAISSTPVLPVIRTTGITSFGNLEFRDRQ